MTGTSAPVAGVTRVSLVYTPPEHRRRGYAAALVAAVSERELAAGAPRACCSPRRRTRRPTGSTRASATSRRREGADQVRLRHPASDHRPAITCRRSDAGSGPARRASEPARVDHAGVEPREVQAAVEAGVLDLEAAVHDDVEARRRRPRPRARRRRARAGARTPSRRPSASRRAPPAGRRACGTRPRSRARPAGRPATGTPGGRGSRCSNGFTKYTSKFVLLSRYVATK